MTQDFREPLYLKDKGVRVEDTRTDEERKYPQLFRQKLEGAFNELSVVLSNCTGVPASTCHANLLPQVYVYVSSAGEGWKVQKTISTIPIPGYNI